MTETTEPTDRLLTEKELAARWGISKKTLQANRWKGEGVSACYLGRSVRYSLRAIEAYERAHTFPSTSAATSFKAAGREKAS